MHASPKIIPPTSKIDKMVNEQDIEKALDALDRQLIPNYAEIGKKFGINRIILIRRHKGISTSKQEATSIYYKLLTDI
jgi:hypothetical protein